MTFASRPHLYEFGPFRLNPQKRLLLREDEPVPLSPKAFDTLLVLVENSGKVVLKDDLMKAVWPDSFVEEANLSQNIFTLRKVLGDSPEQRRYIATVPGQGYQFTETVRVAGAEVQDDLVVESHSRTRVVIEETEHETLPPIAPVPREDIAGTAPWKRRRWRLWRGLGGSSYIALGLAALLIAGLAGSWIWRSWRQPVATSPVIRSLAVLPLENLSGDSSQEYFADGMTDALITDLAQISSLRVISRTSMMRYKGTRKPMAEIARELGVEGIVEGTVFRSGNRVRITSQLIYAPLDQHLWARNYERDLSDIVALQGEVARSIAGDVRAVLSPELRARLADARPVNPEAYELYLQGHSHAYHRTFDDNKKSIEYFQRAVEKDPTFARAYVALAEAYINSSVSGPFPPSESFPKAKAAVTQSLMLDPTCADAHGALGMEMAFYEFDWPGAQKEFIRAIELNPNSAKAHRRYGSYLRSMRRYPEAIVEMEKAVNRDPLSLEMNHFLAVSYEFAGDYERALRQYHRAIEMDPNYGPSRLALADLLAGLGKYEESITQFEKGETFIGVNPGTAVRDAAALRHAFHTSGPKGYWNESLALALRNHNQYGLGRINIAAVYARQGNKDKAFAWLEKSYQAREGIPLSHINSSPNFQNLHGDPRYSDLLRRLGLPE